MAKKKGKGGGGGGIWEGNLSPFPKNPIRDPYDVVEAEPHDDATVQAFVERSRAASRRPVEGLFGAEELEPTHAERYAAARAFEFARFRAAAHGGSREVYPHRLIVVPNGATRSIVRGAEDSHYETEGQYMIVDRASDLAVFSYRVAQEAMRAASFHSAKLAYRIPTEYRHGVAVFDSQRRVGRFGVAEKALIARAAREFCDVWISPEFRYKETVGATHEIRMILHDLAERLVGGDALKKCLNNIEEILIVPDAKKILDAYHEQTDETLAATKLAEGLTKAAASGEVVLFGYKAEREALHAVVKRLADASKGALSEDDVYQAFETVRYTGDDARLSSLFERHLGAGAYDAAGAELATR